MKWITSEGGPLLLLDEQELGGWGGVIDAIDEWPPGESFSPDGFPTDYDRACRISGYLGTIPVGATQALVIADEPLPTTWVPAASGGTIVRYLYTACDDPPVDWLDGLPDSIFEQETTLLVAGETLVLFDAAIAGRDVLGEPAQHLVLNLRPGLYNVKTATYEPNAETSMVLHRLEST